MAAIPPEDGTSPVAYADLRARNEEPAPQRIAHMRAHLGIGDRSLSPEVAEELTRRCTSCRSRATCTRWLLFGGFPREYREFCPNAVRFEELLHGYAQGRSSKTGSTDSLPALTAGAAEILKGAAGAKWLLLLGSALLAIGGGMLAWAVR
ncbi:MAG TPA: hypothetical protein VED46_10760 [Alphaproteobacteria bacterium]|nr:hypothetical protein [Alphaproteobacteria bacterium]